MTTERDHELPDWEAICRRNGYPLANVIMGKPPRRPMNYSTKFAIVTIVLFVISYIFFR
jgi:hypothetical protein